MQLTISDIELATIAFALAFLQSNESDDLVSEKIDTGSVLGGDSLSQLYEKVVRAS